MHPLLRKLGARLPLVLSPMAGVSNPALAAIVSNRGGIGSIGVGNVGIESGRAMIRALRAATDRAFNVNFFVHLPPRRDPAKEACWIARLTPAFAEFGAAPPAELSIPYGSLVDNAPLLRMVVEERPPVVSFHFGSMPNDAIAALKGAGCVLFGSATNVEEAIVLEKAGVDAVVAQGYEAGGHRGAFDPSAKDDELGMMALLRLLVKAIRVPVIAAGGIMDGAGVAASLSLGAAAAQLGTAFIGCPESSADDAYRQALFGAGSAHTVMTRVFSGRRARALPNRFTALAIDEAAAPDYPVAYDAGKALAAAARSKGEGGFGAQWAGQGAPLARSLPAIELMATLEAELRAAQNAVRDDD